MTDLRSFIEKVRQEFPEDVLTISKEVDPRFEITALVVKLEQERRFPILIFENVKGTKFPVVTNVHASRRRLAAAIGSEPRSAVASYLKENRAPHPAERSRYGAGERSHLEGRTGGPARHPANRSSSSRCRTLSDRRRYPGQGSRKRTPELQLQPPHVYRQETTPPSI